MLCTRTGRCRVTVTFCWSTPVMVTMPVLAVIPAAMVSLVLVLSFMCLRRAVVALWKPCGRPPGTLTSSTRLPRNVGLESITVTAETPPFSDIVAGVSTTVGKGCGSSSSMEKRHHADFWPPAITALPVTAPVTRTHLRVAWSALLSTELIVTVPVLVVDPSAKVRTLFELSVKSPEGAGSRPGAGAAETATVTTPWAALSIDAVTVINPLFSGIRPAPPDELVSVSVTVGSVWADTV